jgi:CRP-like cAMP-binding protein
VIGKLPADEGGGDYEVMACGPGALLGERALDHYGPRIDKVLAVSELYVMSVAAARFKEIAKTVEDNVIEEFSMREKVHNILSRPPSLRTRDDLGVVISHVGRKLNILQSLPYDGLIELFRTCDYIISVGKQKLFKQGDEGQAMYIILRGFVHAYDRIGDFTGRFIENAIKVLPAGAGFGGKALCESESGGVTASHLPKSCLRTLTYATEDAETALVVFDKDEFKKISKIIKHELFAEKIALLRRSYVFQSLDLEVLFELAQLMVPCSWKVDSVVHSEGDICDSITIIVLGEMFVNSKAAWNKAINTSMNFGRIGPAAVVGEYCVLCENPENEVVYGRSYLNIW